MPYSIFFEKEATFILDFVNTAEEIRDVFAPYYKETTLDEEINVNLIYGTKTELRKFKLYIDSDKWYSYIILITRMFDKELHMEYSFTSYLAKLIPTAQTGDVDLEGKLKLEFYKLEQTYKGDITLNPTGEDTVLSNPKTINSDKGKNDEDELLEVIIKKINEKFEGMFTESDRVIVETLYAKCLKTGSKLKTQAKNNDSEVFEHSIFPKVFEKVAQEWAK